MVSIWKILNSSQLKRLAEEEAARYDEKYFSCDYWKEDLPGKTGNRGLSYGDPAHSARFDWLYGNLLAQYRGRKILDAGCGPGLLLERALRNGLDVRGIDISTAALSAYQNRVSDEWSNRLVVGRLSDLPYNENEFDVCICLDVLEHLVIHEAIKAVIELCRVTSCRIVCSINLDNPYIFHPTILSRDTWVSLFSSVEDVFYAVDDTLRLNEATRTRYPEYEFFVFDKRVPLY